MTDLSSKLMRFGTEEPVAEPLLLQAGALSAELEDGNLRYVRFHGCEMLRAISFIVRDKDWGTYRAHINNLRVTQCDGQFKVAYEAHVGDATQSFKYAITISGQSDGTLSFVADGEATTDFITNRTGFVVLHPIAGVAGQPCTIETVDGQTVPGRFPALIDPVQPMMNLRALTHAFAPGFELNCRLEGDRYEMEDQRNWTDASFKTYVRPLALPWPYTLPCGERLAQRVLLSVAAAPQATLHKASERVVLSLHSPVGTIPPLGFSLDADDLDATHRAAPALRQCSPQHILVAYDPQRGHDGATLAALVETGRSLNAELWLEAVVGSLDGFEVELAELGRRVQALGSPFSTVLLSPAPDLKCTLPGSIWPACPPLADIYRAARQAFPGVRLGGGMFAFFTELNRKRPPVELLDLVSFTTTSLMHAGDDRSATEGLESLPAVAASVRAFIDTTPYHVGPSAIGMRANPYGDAPMANPHNIRQAMNRMDPRQRGLYAAAWMLGYMAHFTRGGAAALTLGSGAGDFGIVHTAARYPKPWFDDHGGVYPAFHVFKGLSALAHCPAIGLTSSMPREVQAIGALRDGRKEVWVANLTGNPQAVELPASSFQLIAMLDEQCFIAATSDVDFLAAQERPLSASVIELTPYAVVRLR